MVREKERNNKGKGIEVDFKKNQKNNKYMCTTDRLFVF